MKGTIIANFANIKTMDGTAMPSPLAMQIGDHAYGTISVTGSDLIGFDHFYRKNLVRVELGRMCKAGSANMSFTDVLEPGVTPPPVDPPPVEDPKSIVKLLYVETAFLLADGSTSIVRTEPVLPSVP